MTNPCFFYGTLRHLPLLARVIGRDPHAISARLPGHEVREAMIADAPQAFPMLVEGGDGAAGIVFDAGPEDLARLDYYEAGFAFDIRELQVETDAGPQLARVYFPEPGHWDAGAPWRFGDWVADWAAIVTEAADEFLAGMGRISAADALRRYPMMLVRAASRLRARDAKPADLRRRAEPGDVHVRVRRTAFSGYFALEEYDLTHRLFAGGQSATLHREAFVSGDAAVVLPYDPVRDRVLLIEQFRVGPFARGDVNPWLIEPIAGRVDAGETPEDAARREAVEEAGLTVGRMIGWRASTPSPGAKSEYLLLSLRLADIPMMPRDLAGSATKAEDIRAHVVVFRALMALIDSGEADTALLILALWLARMREDLRAHARAAVRPPRGLRLWPARLTVWQQPRPDGAVHANVRKSRRTDRQHAADQAAQGFRGDRLRDPRQGGVPEPRPVGEGPRRAVHHPRRGRAGGCCARAASSSRARPATPASGLRWWAIAWGSAP